MARLYLIQTGQTLFDELGRVESAAGSPLTGRGMAEMQAAAEQLAKEPIAVVYSAGGEAERQSAKILAKARGVKAVVDRELREIDYGLWQGLTFTEMRRRQPKLYRQWTEDPASVRPPDGETVEEVRHRLAGAVPGLLRKQKDAAVLVVARPLVMGLLRALLEHQPPQNFWKQCDGRVCWYSYEVDDEALKAVLAEI